MHTKSCTQCAL